MLWIDTDNAMGSPSGDVDDAFALAALILSGTAIAAISSTGGNTSERKSFANNCSLCARLGWNGALLRGGEAASQIRTFPGRIAALGPLTNVQQAERATEVVVIGGRLATHGRWPPIWPHEFNLTKDAEATRRLFRSAVPLTLFPLDVARQLFVTREELNELPGETGAYLRQGSRRWMRRLRLLKWTGRFPVWDLAAALYLLDPSGFRMENTRALMKPNTFLSFGAGEREVRICRGLDREALWRRFVALCG